MDEGLKRRLIGAVVLLGAAFGLASLLPDPRPAAGRDGDRVVTYDLATGKPVTSAPIEPELSLPEPPPAPTARPALKVDETLGGQAGQWYVQIASFESEANARNARQKLNGLGLPATVQEVSVGKTVWHRVRAGPYPDEEAAERALAAIRKQGYPLARTVKPDSASDRSGN